MKKLLLALSLLCFSTSWTLAQRTISGTVTDPTGEPLIGANILAKNTSVGTVTDIDGTFSLDVPEGAEALVVSYTGFQTREVELGTSTVLDIILSEGISLQDVVVVGYSTVQRKDITGSVSSVNTEAIQSLSGIGVENVLQGRTSGVQVISSNGAPGSGIDVRVRGSTSINASNRPLFVIDGVPVLDADLSQVGVGGQGTNTLADLNPNDIESIEVLKDASLASIYGSRAGNGVVLITTKKGKAGRTNINFDGSYGFQEPWKKVELLDADGFREQMEEMYGDPDFGQGSRGGNTNWYDEIFTPGLFEKESAIQNYALSFSGGSEKTRFFASLGYLDNQGIMKGSAYTRYSARLNLDHVASDFFKMGMNLGYNNSRQQRVRNDNNIYGALSVATLWPPTVPIYNDDGSYANAFGWDNPVATVTIYENNVFQDRIIGNIFGEVTFMEGLSFRANLGIDALLFREAVFEPSALQSSPTGTKTESNTRNIRWLTEYTLNYRKRFDRHSVNAVIGAGFQEEKRDVMEAEVNDFPTDNFSGLSAGATPTNISGSFTGDRLNSFFGSLNYSFDDRYILTATFRADGSSRFINNQFGYFPGVSAAWRISNEAFMANSFFNELKLRAGWGITGNNNIGNFTARQLYGGGANYLDQPGIVPTQLGNPDLRWETTTQINVGLDFGILNSRLLFGVDYYIKNTDDLLFNRPIPTTSGFTSVTTNIGKVRNNGVDLSATALLFDNPEGFNWSITVNANYNRNEVLELLDGLPLDAGFASRIAEGQPIGSFYGWVTDGIFQNQAEVDAGPTQPNAAPGDFRYKDISGGSGPDGIPNTEDDLPPDGVINDADRTFIGQGLPDWFGGVNTSLSYKGFELTAFFQFSVGNDIYNNNLEFAEGMHSSLFNTTRRAWEGRWQQEGDNEDFPRAVPNDPNNNRRNSTRNVEDGSYMRLKTMTLAYTFPRNLFNDKVRNLRLYVTGQNLITWTGYSWFDPEVSTFDVTNASPGTDFLTYPQPRALIFGINLGL